MHVPALHGSESAAQSCAETHGPEPELELALVLDVLLPSPPEPPEPVAVLAVGTVVPSAHAVGASEAAIARRPSEKAEERARRDMRRS